MKLRPGDRVRLILMPDDPSPLDPGEEGVVGHVQEDLFGDRRDQVSVKWDSGRTLSLVVPPDSVQVVGREAVPEPWASLYPKEES